MILITFCESNRSVEYLDMLGSWMTDFEKTSVLVSSSTWTYLLLSTDGKKHAHTVANVTPVWKKSRVLIQNISGVIAVYGPCTSWQLYRGGWSTAKRSSRGRWRRLSAARGGRISKYRSEFRPLRIPWPPDNVFCPWFWRIDNRSTTSPYT